MFSLLPTQHTHYFEQILVALDAQVQNSRVTTVFTLTLMADNGNNEKKMNKVLLIEIGGSLFTNAK